MHSEAKTTGKRQTPMLAISRAGHDKGKVYLVTAADETYVYMVNGSTRPLNRPKKKKRMHVQLVKHLPEEVVSFLEEADSDEKLKNIIDRMKLS